MYSISSVFQQTMKLKREHLVKIYLYCYSQRDVLYIEADDAFWDCMIHAG